MEDNENESPSNNLNNSNTRDEIMREVVQSREKRLMDAIAARKQVEKDAELLKNRVALLQMEERKARKKIEETKKRTSEVVTLKQRNEQRYRQKVYSVQRINEEK